MKENDVTEMRHSFQMWISCSERWWFDLNNLIECLCGYRFCYQCNSPGGRCECNQGHGFLGMEGGGGSDKEYLICR